MISDVVRSKINVICGAWIASKTNYIDIWWIVSREKDIECKTILLSIIDVLKTHISTNTDYPEKLLNQILNMPIEGHDEDFIDRIQRSLLATLVSLINSNETRGLATQKDLKIRDRINSLVRQ